MSTWMAKTFKRGEPSFTKNRIEKSSIRCGHILIYGSIYTNINIRCEWRVHTLMYGSGRVCVYWYVVRVECIFTGMCLGGRSTWMSNTFRRGEPSFTKNRSEKSPVTDRFRAKKEQRESMKDFYLKDKAGIWP